MDCIKIKRLEVFAKHGVFPEENVLGQKFLISLNLYCDTSLAGKTDDLSKSVNYGEVATLVRDFVQDHVFKLIERLAEGLAQEVLLQYPLIQSIDVCVEKPWAPVMMPLETVAVEIHRGWHRAYLSLGSNMGDTKGHLDLAVKRLDEDKLTKVTRVSQYRQTEPVGGVEQDDFLNAAVAIQTLRSPEELLELIGSIESEQKRERKIHWGPRTVDLDILLYDEKIIETEKLTIPHREMKNRQFVLEPMAEIAPYAKHPVNGKTMLELFEHLEAEINS